MLPLAGPSRRKAPSRNFKRRLVSALVLAPLALAAAYFGGWVFVIVCAVAAAAVLWEWTKLVARSAEPRILAPGLAALAVAAALVGISAANPAIATIAIGAVVVGVAWRWLAASCEPPVSASGRRAASSMPASFCFVRRCCANDPQFGLEALLFLFATVWATDIFAYLIGRGIGGPLLWPRLSPNKTWSGAIGGLLGGVAAGIAVAYASGGTRGAIAGVLALVLSIVAQGGDLFESAIKRRFGVKDTSGLIPGHGGVMDRLDGFLVAALAAVLIGILRQGVAAPARGLLAW